MKMKLTLIAMCQILNNIDFNFAGLLFYFFSVRNDNLWIA